jgi:beta-N-acetylhexosaminidase
MSLRELRRHAGRLAVLGFEGHSVPDDLRRVAAAFDLAGVIYFARNIDSPEQVAELSKEVTSLGRDWPLWISVDQEGGRVARLKSPFTEWPPAATLGRSGDDRLAERFATALATELLAVGINLDFLPVLDILTNPRNPVIGDRALSHVAEDVARLGAVLVRALQREGVTACGKHFPGHGDTSVDSHHGLPVVDHDPRRFEAVEWVPFRRAIQEGVATIMTAHLHVPSLDEHHIASFSKRIVTDILKETLAFAGVVFTDDLGMKAVSATTPLHEAAVLAVAAGCDATLLCNSTTEDQVGAIESLIRAAESGVIPQSRLDDAFRRQHAVKARWLRPVTAARVSLDSVGCAAHQMVAREMAAWQ